MLNLSEIQDSIGLATCHHDWQADLPRITHILRTFFSENDVHTGFFPHPEEARIQAMLLEMPSLRAFAEQFAATELKAIIVQALGLSAFSAHDRNLLLFALSLAIGFPTPTEQQHHRIFWDVKSRPSRPDANRPLTFSERTGRADMHTDSSFISMPEEHFLLYTVRSARCGGGASCLIDVNDIVTALMDTRAGRAAQVELTQAWPFEVPSAFANPQANDNESPIGHYPIFSRSTKVDSALNIRWRYDAILKGLAAYPELATPQRLAALSLIHDLIENNVPCFKQLLEDDSLLWVDNHHMLHGRTHFTDPDRHLIRIRIAQQPNASRSGLCGHTTG
ncbi:MAG: TauD/TfdA family dioxygenase [Lautropia sp.]|nr:TauD/TfdA family dioxygenase [Lautropia sp.]